MCTSLGSVPLLSESVYISFWRKWIDSGDWNVSRLEQLPSDTGASARIENTTEINEKPGHRPERRDAKYDEVTDTPFLFLITSQEKNKNESDLKSRTPWLEASGDWRRFWLGSAHSAPEAWSPAPSPPWQINAHRNGQKTTWTNAYNLIVGFRSSSASFSQTATESFHLYCSL